MEPWLVLEEQLHELVVAIGGMVVEHTREESTSLKEIARDRKDCGFFLAHDSRGGERGGLIADLSCAMNGAVKGLATLSLGFLDWKPVELTVAPGECVGVMGGSGSGKTLLLRAIADLDQHVGDVELNGEKCSEMPAPDWRRRVGMLPAESLWWFDTVRPHFAPDSGHELESFVEQLGLPGGIGLGGGPAFGR